MTGRAFAFASSLVLGALCAQGAASCTTTDDTLINIGPTGAPTLSVVSPLSGACIEIPDPKSLVGIPIIVNVEGTFFLRPPGACVGYNNCGHLLLEVGPAGSDGGAPNAVSASSLIDLVPSTLAMPYGDLTLTLLLVDDFGNPWLITDNDAGLLPGEYNGPFSTQITIHTAPTCGDSGVVDAGSSDAGDAGASDAGSSDAGQGDAGMSDAGSSDAGSSDAGSSDAGSSDAGSSDAGSSDAGSSDAGQGDAGSSDAGASDAGTDAGSGAGGAGPGDAGGAGGASAGDAGGAGGASDAG